MDQFDKIIKDKINSKSYDYTPQAWKAFKQNSGMPMMSSGVKFTLIVATASAIIGSVLYYTLVPNHGPQENPAIVCNGENTDNQQIDTIEANVTVATENVSEQLTETTCPTPSPSHKPTTAQTQSQTTVENETPTENTEPAQPQKPQQSAKTIYYGRPLEILVDTISSMDFPEYKAKPADMLP